MSSGVTLILERVRLLDHFQTSATVTSNCERCESQCRARSEKCNEIFAGWVFLSWVFVEISLFLNRDNTSNGIW